MTRLKYICAFVILCCCGVAGLAQNISNKGKEFWVGYGHHQYMTSAAPGGTQDMVLYLSTEAEAAIVTVEIDSSSTLPNVPSTWWRRTYTIPPYTVINIKNTPAGSFSASAGAVGAIPKSGSQDAKLFSDPAPLGNDGEGHWRKKGIHITSNVPIVAYAHIYASVSSGATMLLPVESWGYSYTTINSEQIDAGGPAYSWVYVIAKENNTEVRITPSVTTRLGKPAGVPFDVTLQKGQIYQIIGQSDGSGNGNQFTGTKVVSISSGAGSCKPIAVFAGSSRTRGESDPCGSGSGRDNDMQQCYPEHAWGKRYLTAPFSSSNGATLRPNVFQTSVYKIVVNDPTTEVKRNGTVLTGLIVPGNYYKFSSNEAQFIEADKPIMVGQFMSGSSTCNPGSSGDPEMVYLSPIEQAINSVGFYRNTETSIASNFITLIIPTQGVSSLKIDGVPFSSQTPATSIHSYPHLRNALVGKDYTVIIKGWASQNTQTLITSDSAFNIITYGLGSAESYAYSGGAFINNLNYLPGIHNIPDTSNNGGTIHTFTGVNTPFKLGVMLRYIPTKVLWKFSLKSPANTLISLPDGTAPDVNAASDFWMDPAANFLIDSPIVNGIKYYRYGLPDSFKATAAGIINIPLEVHSPGITNCGSMEQLMLTVNVVPQPTANFSLSHPTKCTRDTVYFSGPATAVSGTKIYDVTQWNWNITQGTTTVYSASTKNAASVFPPGNYTAQLNAVTIDGLLITPITQNFTVYNIPTGTFNATPDTVCLGQNITFSQSFSYQGPVPINKYYWDLADGTTGTAATWTNIVKNYTAPNNYNTRIVVGVSPLCISDTTFKPVVVSGKAIVGFTYPQGCLDPSGVASFTANSNAQGGATITSWSWDFGDPGSGTANTATGQTVSHTYTTPGQYPVKLTVVTNTGCSGDSTITVNANIKASLSYAALPAICQDAAPVSVASATVTNSIAGTGYYYDASGATTNTGTFDPAISGAGSHTIWYVYTTTTGCKDSVSQPILVNATPTAPTVTSPVNYCQNGTATQLSATASAGSSLTWYNNPGLTGGSATAPTPSTATAGTFKFYVTQTSNAGCISKADSITVNVSASITNNNIGRDTTLCEGSPAIPLTGTAAIAGGDGTFVYQWQQSPDGTTWSNIPGAANAFYDPGTLTATTKFRRNVESSLCQSTSNTVTITIVPQITNYNITGGQPVCEGLVPTLLDGQTPSGTGNTFVWQSSPDGINFTNIAGATFEDYQSPILPVTTYFRRITTNGTCTVISNVDSITVSENANGSITAPATICQYQSADITFVATAGTAPFSISYTITDPSGSSTTVNQTGVSNNAVFNVIPAGSAAGNYSVALNSITNSNGCIKSTGLNTVSISVTATPIVTINPISPICEGGSVTLTASGATDYNWSGVSGSNLSATSGSTVTSTPTGSGSFNISVSASTNGCNASPVNIDVVVNPKPTAPTVTTTSYSYCQFGTAVPFDATGAPGNTLNWYNNPGLTGGTTSPTYTPSTANAGTITYYVTQTNSFGCQSLPATITVTVNAGLSGNTISADETLCQGGTPAAITGTGTLTGGNGTYTYQWQSSPDGTTWTDIPGATSANYSPGPLADTTHFKRNVTSSQCGSSSNVVIKYVFEGLGNYDIAANQTICESTAPALIDGGAPTGSGPFTFTWQQSADGTNWNNIPSSNTEDYQPPVLTTTTYYRRTVTNGPCTASSSAVKITVDPIANGNFTAPAAICEYDAASVTYNATVGTGPFDIEYSITDPSGTTATTTLSVNNGATINVIPTGSAPGVYTVTLLSIENSNGCIRTTGLNSVTITVNATPVVTIDPVNPVCIDEARILTANGAATYTWIGTNLSSLTGNSVTATPATAGTHTYSVVGASNGCNSDTVSIDLIVHPKPTVNIIVGDNEICITEQGSFSATSSIPTGSVQNYYWDFDNGVTEVTTGTIPTNQTYGTHRTYVTKLYAVSAEGCTSVTDTAHIHVNPLPVASFDLPAFVCMPGGLATFQNTSTIPNGANLNYTWTFGDPASGSSDTSITEDGSHVYPDSASYDITLVATSAQGCTHQLTRSFNTFYNKPVAKFGVTPDTLCQGIQNAFFDSSFAPGSAIDSRLWTFGDGTTASGSSPTKTYLHPGTYQVRLDVSNSQGCTADTTKTIVVYLQPVVDVGPSFIVPEGTTVTFNAQTNSGALSFAWTSPTGGVVSDPTIVRPTHTAVADHVFVLTATGEGNCIATDTLSVKVLRPIIIPNAFSPNGDGINDTWGITNLGDYPNAVVEVFNRFGQPVFRSLGGYSKAWDGKLNGKELPIGTYYYIIEPKNGFAKVTGYVVLVK
jgi:gliding motility-associated-like protein